MICLDARTAVFCQLGEESSISSKQISFSSDIICADDGLVLLSNGQLYNIVDGEIEAKIDLNMGVLSAAFFYEEKQRRLIIGRENDAVCCDIFTKELSVGDFKILESMQQINSIVLHGDSILVGHANGTSCFDKGFELLQNFEDTTPIEGGFLAQIENQNLILREAVCGLRVKTMPCKKAMQIYSAGYRSMALRSSNAYICQVATTSIIGSMVPACELETEDGRKQFKKQWDANQNREALAAQLRKHISLSQNSVVSTIILCELWNVTMEFLPAFNEASLIRLLNARPRVTLIWAIARKHVTAPLMVAACKHLVPVAAVLMQLIRAVKLRIESVPASLQDVPELPSLA